MNRKTGLRRVPLEPGTPPQRRTPLARNAPRQAPRTPQGAREPGAKGKSAGRRETGFSRAVKLAVRTRAGNGDPDEARCEATGVWLGRHGGEIQHRDARGMGGTSDPVTDSLVNAVLLSEEAHRLAESRDEHMNAMGFWLRNGQDPRTEPIMLHGEDGGITVWLAEDGIGFKGTGYLYEAPKELAA